MISSDGDAAPRRYPSPMDPTDAERETLAPFVAAWFGDDPKTDRRCAVPLQDAEGAEDEYNGFDEDNRDLWWTGEDFVIRDEDREIYYAGGILPSERFYARRL